MIDVRVWLLLLILIPSSVRAQTSRVPKWDARGLGPLPSHGISAMDVNSKGTRVVVGTTAMPGDPNVLVLSQDGLLVQSFRVGQRWIGQVVAGQTDEAFALGTMTTGASGDEPQVYYCKDESAILGGSNGSTSLFHYGDHSNHVGKQLARTQDGVVTVGEGQLFWSRDQAAHAKSPSRTTGVGDVGLFLQVQGRKRSTGLASCRLSRLSLFTTATGKWCSALDRSDSHTRAGSIFTSAPMLAN